MIFSLISHIIYFTKKLLEDRNGRIPIDYALEIAPEPSPPEVLELLLEKCPER